MSQVKHEKKKEEETEINFGLSVQSILSKKEKIVESFLRDLSSCVDFESAETSSNNSSSSNNGGGTTTTGNEGGGFDECDEQTFLQDMEKKLANASILLSNKYGPILKQFMSQKQQQMFSELYVRIPRLIQTSSDLNLSVVYNKCLLNWIDSPFVSVASPNKILLKNILPKDLYLLTFYSMACVKRVKFDECFSLSVVGRSSTGKTRFLESVLLEAAFTFNSEKGVGRYNGCKHRPIIMYHDVDISVLYKGTDGQIFRSLSRTEPTNVKVHSGLITLPPLWVLISANQRINNHTFEKNSCQPSATSTPSSQSPSMPATATSTTAHLFHSFFLSGGGGGGNNNNKVVETYESQLQVPGSKRELMQESLTAVRMRVLELFVKAAPNLESTPLPSGTLFTRLNLIVGLFDKIVQILKKYSVSDFHSPLLVSYVLTALCSNFKLYNKMWPDCYPSGKVTNHDVASLVISHVSDFRHRELYFKMLDSSDDC